MIRAKPCRMHTFPATMGLVAAAAAAAGAAANKCASSRSSTLPKSISYGIFEIVHQRTKLKENLQ